MDARDTMEALSFALCSDSERVMVDIRQWQSHLSQAALEQNTSSCFESEV